jgi:hypothetical protein
MEDNTPITIFPKTRVKPFDGMSVTADAWMQAHNEHRQALQAHDLFFHGSGIVCGLEVTANDPPDQYAFISPGVAVDPVGNVIVLTETVAYDFSASAEGLLFLVLGHGERESGGVETEVKYTHDEFVIAARPSMPKRPVVELARVMLAEAGKPIQSASDAAHPRTGELDLRFRTQLEPRVIRPVQVGVCSLGKDIPEAFSGWDYLGRECQRSSFCKLVVDTGISLAADLSRFDVVCLSASGTFKPEDAAVKSLRAYLKAGKPLLVEALDLPAESAFGVLFEKLERKLQPLPAYDALLTSPYLFNTPPGGQVLRDKLVIYATGGFSPAWSGKNAASRAEIRSAHEWGINLLNACLNRSG